LSTQGSKFINSIIETTIGIEALDVPLIQEHVSDLDYHDSLHLTHM
jgi:hypothetical protein